MSELKLGLKPFTADKRDLLFANYRTSLLAVPAEFGHYGEIPHGGWGMLGNDSLGDCAPCGGAHSVMQDTAEGTGRPVVMSTANTEADYFAMNGVPPGPPGSSSDQGTNPNTLLNYCVNTGMADATGTRHPLAGYTQLEAGNLQELAEATYLFGAAGVCLALPQSAQDYFQTGYWRVVPGDNTIVGGHYVICVGRWNGYYELISWGARVHATAAFLTTYCNGAYGTFSAEILNGKGKSPEGWDRAQLQDDLTQL
jgi:hypothetical protein